METLDTHLRRIALGVLSNTAYIAPAPDYIATGKRETVINAINIALDATYTKFKLTEKSVMLDLKDGKTRYPLRESETYRAMENEPEGEPSIFEGYDEPFEGRVLKVLRVYDQFGKQLRLNDPEDPLSVFTPEPDIIEYTRPYTGGALAVTYQTAAPIIPLDALNSYVVDIPKIIHLALDAYIGYTIFSAIGTQEASGKAAEHIGMYLQHCNNIVEHDLANTSYSQTNTRFHLNGWV